MNVLIVHAHPEPRSRCSSMCSTAYEHLQGRGHDVHVSDLYAMNFDPFANSSDSHELEIPDYLAHGIEQRHAQETDSLAPGIRAEIGKLLWCDLLILNFPVLGFSTPAMLKGWIDRVLVPGMEYGRGRFHDRRGLAGKRVLVTATLGAQQHMMAESGILGSLDDMLRHLLLHTLANTGMTLLPPFADWHVPHLGHERRGRLLKVYREHLDQPETMVPWAFYGPDDSDTRLHPV